MISDIDYTKSFVAQQSPTCSSSSSSGPSTPYNDDSFFNSSNIPSASSSSSPHNRPPRLSENPLFTFDNTSTDSFEFDNTLCTLDPEEVAHMEERLKVLDETIRRTQQQDSEGVKVEMNVEARRSMKGHSDAMFTSERSTRTSRGWIPRALGSAGVNVDSMSLGLLRRPRGPRPRSGRYCDVVCSTSVEVAQM